MGVSRVVFIPLIPSGDSSSCVSVCMSVCLLSCTRLVTAFCHGEFLVIAVSVLVVVVVVAGRGGGCAGNGLVATSRYAPPLAQQFVFVAIEVARLSGNSVRTCGV